MKIETLAVHAGREPDPATGALREPIHLSTTFERNADGSYPHGHYYTRAGNPNRSSLERAIAALEGGADAVAFASGSAATLAAFSLAAPGGRVVCSSDCYHGTAKQLRELLPKWGLGAEFVDTTDPGAVARALESPTAMLWIETPSNPLLRVSDIAALAALALARGALVACDNTFASPILQQPFTLGADLVMHSTTKYLGGHSDVLGGVLVVRERGSMLDRLREFQATAGGVPSPFDCWLVLRSLATLPLRVRAQSANAAAVAQFLSQDRRVERVYYPGLVDHTGHALAARQMSGGFGAVLSFQVPGGANEAMLVAARAKIFTRATSLGGVESLVEHRASMEGPLSRTPQNLLRVAIGLEAASDLIADLDVALGA
ncbi:MAG: aminotransferase class I/II-fold pyridoxal phosphate-dependent enzyme [Gammaproteobacteria bacterium]|nr:aminotransferase class I/II-fold pyridoxal phosphate-dependent enzyme [Gammaproteobacteria bacterium]